MEDKYIINYRYLYPKTFLLANVFLIFFVFIRTSRDNIFSNVSDILAYWPNYISVFHTSIADIGAEGSPSNSCATFCRRELHRHSSPPFFPRPLSRSRARRGRR